MGGCLQLLGSVPGNALVYRRKVFLCPSHPQLKLEEGCTFHLFLDVGHTGHLPVSVAWERAAVMCRASRLTEKHCCSSPEGEWSALLPYPTACLQAKITPVWLCCTWPQVRRAFQHRFLPGLNIFKTHSLIKMFLTNQNQHEKSANKINWIKMPPKSYPEWHWTIFCLKNTVTKVKIKVWWKSRTRISKNITMKCVQQILELILADL